MMLSLMIVILIKRLESFKCMEEFDEDTNYADEELDPKEHVYQPEEDTYLLLDSADEYAKGDILEVGCGSGFISVELASKGFNVECCDINPIAIEETNKLAKKEGVKVDAYVSDLFSDVMNNYDTILFNPPYLPHDENEPYDDIRLATTGGEEGYEIIERFFEDVICYLKEGGQILLLFSSLTKQEKVDEIIKENGFKFEQVNTSSHFFETLYVYRITKND